MNITPAILPHSLEEINEKLSRVEGVVQRVQIDLSDGIFGREKTWMPDGIFKFPEVVAYEFDIMVADWKKVTQNAIAAGAMCIVSHVDSFTNEDLKSLVEMVSPRGLLLGISVSNDKTVEFHAEKIQAAQALYSDVYVQVMGIRSIGEQGQIFDEETPSRVKALRQLFPSISIQVDGAMIPETAKRVQEMGADTVVVGSYIFGEHDAREALTTLCTTLDA